MKSTEASKVSILVCDDRPENLLSLEAALGPLQVDIVKAASGEEALRRLLDQEFAVLILDVQMPGLDGYETATLIRSRESLSYMPIIFLTAILTSEPHIFKGYEAGAVDYLLKPIAPEILRSKVRSFVELFKKNAEVKRQSEMLRQIEQREKEREKERADELDILVRQRTAELALSNRDLETMFYVATHDLKEPLNAVENFAVILNDRYSSGMDEKGKDFLRRIIRGTKRMRNLLDGLLVLTRAKQIESTTERVYGDEVVNEVLARYSDKIQETGARILVEKNLPELKAHRTWVTEALANLVSNALKFRKPGEAPEIEIGPYDGPEGTGIAVRDRGPGITPLMKERIFQLFQRGVGQEIEGTGAGLAIVRQIAERHGGKAFALDREAGGSEFIVTFGMREVAWPVSHLLLVDDDEDYLYIMKEMFATSDLPVDVDVARNGNEALARLRKVNGHKDSFTPELVFLDINMPQKNGFEVLAEMKSDTMLKNIPVVMLTTSNRIEDREMSYATGADDFISKTLGFEKITEIVRRFSGTSHQNKNLNPKSEILTKS